MTEANFSKKNLGPGDAIIISAWLSHKDNGALSILSLKENYLYAEGNKALAAGLKGNQGITELDISSNRLGWKGYGAPDMSGVIALANALPDMRALTSLDLSSNYLYYEGAKHIAEGIKVPSMRLRLFSYNFHAHLTTG
jgi:Ran GTPase-activating protein (RanGAP) involved in mRNA processing and transport